MIKYPKIKRIGDAQNDGILESDDSDLYVQEKMDGANFRFTLQRNIDQKFHDDDRDIVFGSRNVVYKNEKDVDGNFEHAVEHVRENVDLSEMKRIDDEYGPLTFFGEAMHPHTLEYDWENTPSFLGFDVFSAEKANPAAPDSVELFFEQIGLDSVEFVGLDRVIDGFDCPESLYRDGLAEGVVVKNAQTGQRAKIRSEKFKELHSTSKSSNSEGHEPEDAQVLAHQFATDARILKMIHKYDDRGRDIEMEVMEDLWRDVFDDIIEEEYDTIFLGNHTIDTQQFRSEVASRTANVLQTYLSRPDDSVLNEASV